MPLPCVSRLSPPPFSSLSLLPHRTPFFRKQICTSSINRYHEEGTTPQRNDRVWFRSKVFDRWERDMSEILYRKRVRYCSPFLDTLCSSFSNVDNDCIFSFPMSENRTWTLGNRTSNLLQGLFHSTPPQSPHERVS